MVVYIIYHQSFKQTQIVVKIVFLYNQVDKRLSFWVDLSEQCYIYYIIFHANRLKGRHLFGCISGDIKSSFGIDFEL